MQYHLEGFVAGDPDVHGREFGDAGTQPSRDLPAEVDVLIVGCGPAGLTLAAQLAAFPEITTRIVEQKSGPLQFGQADGIACRTIEMFNAFGFAERVVREAYWVNETTFWKPDDARPENITHSRTIQDTEDGLSEFPHVILSQARVHDFYLDVMRNAPAHIVPDYCRRLTELSVAEQMGKAGSRPVTVTLERLDPGHEGQTETVKARYVVGCDGARSAVRTALGHALHGDSANQAWGVMDVLAVTDFPDIRRKTLIQSANEGNVLIIPREGGYMVRLYIELDKLNADERISSRNLAPEHLVAAANRILHPYTLDVKEIAWWSVYEIGQRLCDRFDDADGTGGTQRHPHVFITGDACHTHSPKAGQGMNVSMGDSFNLGWKLAAVLRGHSRLELLSSYSAERQAIARELIDFDREFAAMFSAPPKTADSVDDDGVDPAELQRYFVQHGRFTAGTAVRYRPSTICGQPDFQHLAEGFTIGMRFHSAPVIRLADAKPLQLGHVIKADGRWRLFAFAGAGEPAENSSAIGKLCDFLAASPASPLRKYTPADADIDAVIDLRVIFQQAHHGLAVEAMPELLRPQKGRYGLRDYEKMFCPDMKSGNDIFDMRGIDRQSGCLVIVRPDQYVAHILPLDAHEALAAFFDGFMLARG